MNENEKFKFKKDGKVIEFTCEESKLGNLHGKNLEAPQYLTRVFFRKEVLDKYYNKPSKYSVEDGYLFFVKENGVNEWGVPLDNNARDCIMVYLGDLGRMPYEEQKYWKIYNIEKGSSSPVSYKRDFEAEFCSPTEPALYFKEKFEIFNGKWKNKFRWDLFKPLHKEDEHHIKSLRIPSEEQKEFDEVILSLNKLLIDSLNVNEMKKDLVFDDEDKTLSIFEKYLNQKHRLNFPEMFGFLRNLQELRSKGSAHRKGSNYNETYGKFDKESFSKTFKFILIQSIKVLNTIENKSLGKKNDTSI